MHGLVYMASRDKVDVNTFHKGIQYALERLGKSKFGFESTTVSNFKSKSREGSGNELVDYSRAPCLGADQKAGGLWERDCNLPSSCRWRHDIHCFDVVFTTSQFLVWFLVHFIDLRYFSLRHIKKYFSGIYCWSYLRRNFTMNIPKAETRASTICPSANSKKKLEEIHTVRYATCITSVL